MGRRGVVIFKVKKKRPEFFREKQRRNMRRIVI